MSHERRKKKNSIGYNIFDGTNGQRQKKNGAARRIESFSTAILSTGENPLIDDNDRGGAHKRVIQVRISKPLLSVSEARNLHKFLKRNYGHFLHGWVDYIAEHREQIKRDFDLVADYFAKEFLMARRFTVPVDLSEFESTHVYAIIAAIVAFYHFRIFRQLDDSFQYEDALIDASRIIERFPRISDIDDAQRVISKLSAYLSEHPNDFYSLGPDNRVKLDVPRNFQGMAGIIYPDGRVAILPNAFKHITENVFGFINSSQIAQELKSRGILSTDTGRTTKTIRFGEDRAHVYLFNADTIRQRWSGKDNENLTVRFDRYSTPPDDLPPSDDWTPVDDED